MKPRRHSRVIAVRCTEASSSHLLKAGQIYYATFGHPPLGRVASGTLNVQIQTKKQTLVKPFPRSMFVPLNPDNLGSFPMGRFEPLTGEALRAA